MQQFDDGVHPISFNSRSLLPAEKNYDAHDKELAGMIFGFKCGRQYFLGAQHPIQVHTNHKNLQYFKEPQKITGQQAWWMEFLQDFNYHIEHIPGTINTIADLLSCRKDLNKGVDSDLPRILLPDTLFLQKTFLKDNKNLRRNILWQIHDSPAGGHPGIANTWELVRHHYEGPRLWDFVKQYVKGCHWTGSVLKSSCWTDKRLATGLDWTGWQLDCSCQLPLNVTSPVASCRVYWV